jgi:cell division septation protein DedD
MASRNIKNFELRLGKTGLFIVIVGMAALLCTVFLLGVDIGKNIDTYPEQIASIPQKVIAHIWRSAKLKVDQDVPDNKSGQNQPQDKENIDLTFYNTLTAKKSVVKEQPVPDRQKVVETPTEKPVETKPQKEETGTGDLNREAQKPAEPVNEKTNEEGKPKAKEAAPSIASPINREAQKPAEPVSEKTDEEGKPKAKEAAPSIASSKQKFIIQAASLKEKNKAYQISKKIAALGFESLIVPMEIKEKGIWYRVIVSGFDERTQAQAAADKIAKKIKTNCIVRRVDVEVRKN